MSEFFYDYLFRKKCDFRFIYMVKEFKQYCVCCRFKDFLIINTTNERFCMMIANEYCNSKNCPLESKETNGNVNNFNIDQFIKSL